MDNRSILKVMSMGNLRFISIFLAIVIFTFHRIYISRSYYFANEQSLYASSVRLLSTNGDNTREMKRLSDRLTKFKRCGFEPENVLDIGANKVAVFVVKIILI